VCVAYVGGGGACLWDSETVVSVTLCLSPQCVYMYVIIIIGQWEEYPSVPATQVVTNPNPNQP